MIELKFTKTGFHIQERSGSFVLDNPLHRLYLRSVLGASSNDAVNVWHVGFGPKPEYQLNGILQHFSKYKIDTCLDQKCAEMLEAERNKKDAYESILLAAGKIKKLKAGEMRELHSGKFARELTQLQKNAIQHLLTIQNGANFSVPGSGKTTVALAYYNQLRLKKCVDGILVIGPASCFDPWEKEYELCFSLCPRVTRIAGNSRNRRRELIVTSTGSDLLLTTYHSAARDLTDLQRLLSRRRLLLILDESHYVKRPQGGKLAETVLALSQFATRRLILTGTPMPNGLADLWTQITFLWPDQLPLGPAEQYLRNILSPNSTNVYNDVAKKIYPLFFRTTKSQLNLPRPSFKIFKCEMSALQRRIYTGVAIKLLMQSGEAPHDRDTLRMWRRARAVRLLQVAVNPTLLCKHASSFNLPPFDMKGIELRDAITHYPKYEISSKMALAIGLARKICEQGNKVLIWSVFVHNLTMLSEHLKELNPAVIHGEVPYSSADEDELTRESLIRKFREDESCRILIANPAACSESISLHKICHDAIYLDRSFNCAHYLQSLDRIHRLGLPSGTKTNYYLLMSKNSVDEVVHDRLKQKMRAMRSIVEADLPGGIPGYWDDDLGDEEDLDIENVETHIRKVVSYDLRKTN